MLQVIRPKAKRELVLQTEMPDWPSHKSKGAFSWTFGGLLCLAAEHGSVYLLLSGKAIHLNCCQTEFLSLQRCRLRHATMQRKFWADAACSGFLLRVCSLSVVYQRRSLKQTHGGKGLSPTILRLTLHEDSWNRWKDLRSVEVMWGLWPLDQTALAMNNIFHFLLIRKPILWRGWVVFFTLKLIASLPGINDL